MSFRKCRGTGTYVLITPCRDEADHAERCIQSVLRQIRPPSLWVIVDDGSSDCTPEILERYAQHDSWIKIVRLSDRGRRSVGPGVVEAFYEGLKRVDLGEFEYLCKFDLDLEIHPGYFAELIRRMEAEPRLGTCSGKPYFIRDNRWVSERCGDEMSVGMTKFYRVSCFLEIGGFVRQVMWDGIDCHRCRMSGWIACSWDEPGLRFLHLRPMGSSGAGIKAGRLRHGFGQYYLGTGWLYLVVSAFYRCATPPYVLGGLWIFLGYFLSAARRLPRYGDEGFVIFLRRYHRRCLWKGKARATAELHERLVKVVSPPSTGVRSGLKCRSWSGEPA